MKRNLKILEHELISSIAKIHETGLAKDVKDKAIYKLKDYFMPQKIKQIFNQTVPLSALAKTDLYHITLFLIDNNWIDININEFFDDEEIRQAIVTVIDVQTKYDKEVRLYNVLYNKEELDEQYITILSYQEIAKMYDEGILNYNFSTQRKAQIVKYRGRIDRVASLNKNNVYAIKERMKEKDFQMNTITFNIRVSGEEEFSYDPGTNQLVIDTKSTLIDLIDGYHRALAIYYLWLENHSVEGYMIVSIKHLTIERARHFIAQEAKGTLNNQEEMRLYDNTSNVAKLINEINRYSNPGNILRQRITTGNSTPNTIVFYDIFAEIMDRAWGDKLGNIGGLELPDIREFICDFYYIAYSHIQKKFKVDKIDDLKNTPALDQMLFSGFLYPARTMYDENYKVVSRQMIEQMVNKIDFETKDRNKFSYEDITNRYQMAAYEKAWRSII